MKTQIQKRPVDLREQAVCTLPPEAIVIPVKFANSIRTSRLVWMISVAILSLLGVILLNWKWLIGFLVVTIWPIVELVVSWRKLLYYRVVRDGIRVVSGNGGTVGTGFGRSYLALWYKGTINGISRGYWHELPAITFTFADRDKFFVLPVDLKDAERLELQLGNIAESSTARS